MINITAANKLPASIIASKTTPGNGAAGTPAGTSFGALLAQQVVDKPSNTGETPPALIAQEADILAKKTMDSSKTQGDKTPAIQSMSADLSGNTIALLQPSQEIRSQTTNSILPDKPTTASKVHDAKSPVAQSAPVDLPVNMIALPQTPQEVPTQIAKPILSDKATGSSKTQGNKNLQDNKNPVAQNMPVDLSANMIALPQSLQEVRTPAAAAVSIGTDVVNGAGTKPIIHDLPGKPIDTSVAKDTAVTATSKADVAPPGVKQIEIQGIATAAGNQPASPLAQNLAMPHTSNLPGSMPSVVSGSSNLSQQSIYSPLGNSGWANEFSQKISWMSTGQQQTAELHLNPPDLGPLNVVLKISDNQATVAFTSPHSAVREAVENAMPKLREILADNGITLGNTTVSDQPQRDGNTAAFTGQQSQHRSGHWADQGSAQTDISARPISQSKPVQRHNGMVDTFA